ELLTPDHYPHGQTYADRSVRLASSFRVRTRDHADQHEGRRDIFPGPGELILQPVEILAGPAWLIVCWHPRRVYRGIKVERELPSGEPGGRFREAIEHRWRGYGGTTSGDLGVLLLHELALTYAPVYYRLYDWLEETELSFYVTSHIDQAALAEIWSSMALLRHWISPLHIAGVRSDRDKAWLPNVTLQREVNRVDDRVDGALDRLRELATALRSAFNTTYSKLEEQARERQEATRRRVELIAAGFLVPTLVVGLLRRN